MAIITLLLCFFVDGVAFAEGGTFGHLRAEVSGEEGCRVIPQRLSLRHLAGKESFFEKTYSNVACPNDFDVQRCDVSCQACPVEETCQPNEISTRTLQTQIGERVYAFEVEEHLKCSCVGIVSGVDVSGGRPCREGSDHVPSGDRNDVRCDSVTDNGTGWNGPYFTLPTMLVFVMFIYKLCGNT